MTTTDIRPTEARRVPPPAPTRRWLPPLRRPTLHRPLPVSTIGPAVVAVLCTLVVATDSMNVLIRPVAGMILMVLLPTYLVMVKKEWPRSTTFDIALYSFGYVLLTTMVGGLVMNQALPPLGISQPLTRIPVLVATDIAIAVLICWRRQRGLTRERLEVRTTRLRRSLAPIDRRLIAASGVAVALSAIGATRLNNGAGSGVTMAMLCLVAALIVALLAYRHLSPTTPVVMIYLLSTALLFMTSLRGWGIIGHDSQVEFYVFQLTKNAGFWHMDSFRSAYNACLSINILPTMLSVMTGMSGAYVFKILYPLAFALCPVIVYLIAQRFSSREVAILSAVYFISFPTFFTDIPFLNRQIIAFLFVGMILWGVTNRDWAAQRRRVLVALLSIGLVLSHYSTTYLVIAIFTISLGAHWSSALAARLWTKFRRRPRVEQKRQPWVVGIANLAVLVVAMLLWTGPATHSGAQVERTGGKLISSLLGDSDAQRSSDTAYAVGAGKSQSPQEKLTAFTDQAVEETGDARAAGLLFPVDLVQRYPVVAVDEDKLPLTGVGRVLDAVGVDVPALNAFIRQGAARTLQVFICVGLVVVALRRSRWLQVSREMYFLSLAAFTVVLLQVALPALSVDYGVLRAFQQALFLLAPFLVAGSLYLFSWPLRRRAFQAAAATALVFYLSLTGVVPQALGGYPAQLHLNNSGEYYRLYYTHPEEDAAADWVEVRLLDAGQGVVQTQIADRFLFALSPTIDVERSVYPMLIRSQDYVLLGDAIVSHGQGAVPFGGDRITYRYPLNFLDDNMDRIYSNGRSVVYR